MGGREGQFGKHRKTMWSQSNGPRKSMVNHTWAFYSNIIKKK